MPPNDTDMQFESIPEVFLLHCTKCSCRFHRAEQGANTSSVSGYVPTGAALIQIWTLYIVGYCSHSPVIIVVLQIFFNEVFRETVGHVGVVLKKMVLKGC